MRWMDRLRGCLTNGVPEAVLGGSLCSPEMAAAQRLWMRVFEGRAPWLGGKTRPVGLAALSTAHLARLVNAELTFSVSGGPRGAFLDRAVREGLLPRMNEAVQLAMAGGMVAFKPYITGGRTGISVVRADGFWPQAFDPSGRMTAAVFFERGALDGKPCLRAETHALEPGGRYRVGNRAFLCGRDGTPGKELPVGEVPAWADYAAETVLEGMEKPLFAVLRMPVANTVDGESPLPVSIYAGAVSTLEDIDRLYAAYCWEFWSGRRKVYVDELAFRRNEYTGRPEFPDDDLYVALNAAGQGTKLFENYTPELREADFRNGLNQLLRVYEAQTGVSAGTYSFSARDGRITATQVLAEDRNTFYTVRAVQEAARTALLDLLGALDVCAGLRGLAPEGRYEPVITFGDSVFEDTQSEFERRARLVGMGMRPELLVSWYLGVSEEAARGMLAPEKKEGKRI